MSDGSTNRVKVRECENARLLSRLLGERPEPPAPTPVWALLSAPITDSVVMYVSPLKVFSLVKRMGPARAGPILVRLLLHEAFDRSLQGGESILRLDVATEDRLREGEHRSSSVNSVGDVVEQSGAARSSPGLVDGLPLVKDLDVVRVGLELSGVRDGLERREADTRLLRPQLLHVLVVVREERLRTLLARGVLVHHDVVREVQATLLAARAGQRVADNQVACNVSNSTRREAGTIPAEAELLRLPLRLHVCARVGRSSRV